MKGFALLAPGVATLALAPAAAADTTPAAPATLLNQWLGGFTLEGAPPQVLVAADLTVAAGGQPGTIRIRATYRGRNEVGEAVHLPAEPGTYRFAAPHIPWDYRGSQLGFDQVSGGHAVVLQNACLPERGDWGDPCKIMRVNVLTPPGAEENQPILGAQLAIKAIYETDYDGDLAGDKTEDRTDLKVSASTSRDPDGTVRIVTTVVNLGPRVADLPDITTALNNPKGGDQVVTIEGCHKPGSPWHITLQGCVLARPLAVGETRRVTMTADLPEAVDSTVTVEGDGPDLTPADNTVRVATPAVTPLALTTAKSARLRSGVKLQLVGIRDGRVRATAVFKRGGKTVNLAKTVTLQSGRKRTVTLKATGAKLRSLRRLADGRPLKASVRVQSVGTDAVAKANVTVRP